MPADMATEGPESALCSRWLTTRRMSQYAPKRTLLPPNPCGGAFLLLSIREGAGLARLSDDVSKRERTPLSCSPHSAVLFKEIGFAVCTFGEKPI